MEIRRAVVYFDLAAKAFSAGIHCLHCSTHTLWFVSIILSWSPVKLWRDPKQTTRDMVPCVSISMISNL